MNLDFFRNSLRPYVNNKTATRIFRFIESLKYMDLDVWNLEKSNQIISDALTSQIPQAIGKIGSAELFALKRYLRYQYSPNSNELTSSDRKTLGLYPDNFNSFERYAQLILEGVLPEMTILGTWFNLGEAKLVKKYARKAAKISMFALESYTVSHDRWTSHLKGKNVLVVSPFPETIKQQYEKRHLLWPAMEDVLPDFDLYQIKVPYHISLAPPSHPDWFLALEDLKQQMSIVPFDIALIGASVFSLPLTVHAKKLGKCGIHLGGATQIYFGIKGHRWENNPVISKYFNDHWTFPMQAETPSNAKIMENGCYW